MFSSCKPWYSSYTENSESESKISGFESVENSDGNESESAKALNDNQLSDSANLTDERVSDSQNAEQRSDSKSEEATGESDSDSTALNDNQLSVSANLADERVSDSQNARQSSDSKSEEATGESDSDSGDTESEVNSNSNKNDAYQTQDSTDTTDTDGSNKNIKQDDESDAGLSKEIHADEDYLTGVYANYMMKINTDLSEADAFYIAKEIQLKSAELGYIDTETIMAVAMVESRFRPYLTGNYVGLFQTSKKYGAAQGYTEEMLLDPHYNIEYAMSILDDAYKKLDGNLTYALLAFNQGYYGFKAKLDSGAELSTDFADNVYAKAEIIKKFVAQ